MSEETPSADENIVLESVPDVYAMLKAFIAKYPILPHVIEGSASPVIDEPPRLLAAPDISNSEDLTDAECRAIAYELARLNRDIQYRLDAASWEERHAHEQAWYWSDLDNAAERVRNAPYTLRPDAHMRRIAPDWHCTGH